MVIEGALIVFGGAVVSIVGVTMIMLACLTVRKIVVATVGAVVKMGRIIFIMSTCMEVKNIYLRILADFVSSVIDMAAETFKSSAVLFLGYSVIALGTIYVVFKLLKLFESIECHQH